MVGDGPLAMMKHDYKRFKICYKACGACTTSAYKGELLDWAARRWAKVRPAASNCPRRVWA